MLPVPELILASLIVALGALIQGSVGMGLGLLAAPLLVLIDPALVPAPLIVTGTLMVLILTVREHASVRFGEVAWAVVGCAIGTGGAALLLARMSAETFLLVFGLLLLAAVVMSAIKWHPVPTRSTVFAAGSISGLMGTITAIGGPPVALIYQRSSGGRLRGTLSAYFIASSVFALGGLAWAGRFGVGEVVLGLQLIPGLLVGVVASAYTRHWIDGTWMRPAVLILSSLAAAAILTRYFV